MFSLVLLTYKCCRNKVLARRQAQRTLREIWGFLSLALFMWKPKSRQKSQCKDSWLTDSMNTGSTEYCKSNVEPSTNLLQKLFRKYFGYISTNSGKQVLGHESYGHNSQKCISMDNLAQNSPYKICYVKELEGCKGFNSTWPGKGTFYWKRNRGRQDISRAPLQALT